MSCPGDKVVWVNTKSGIYHFKGERWFGNTQQGKYMCEHAADAEGDRATHNGQEGKAGGTVPDSRLRPFTRPKRGLSAASLYGLNAVAEHAGN